MMDENISAHILKYYMDKIQVHDYIRRSKINKAADIIHLHKHFYIFYGVCVYIRNWLILDYVF